MLLIESPLGLLNAYAIAASSPRIIAVSFGGEDFSRELGLPLVRTGEAKELIVARSNLAIAAAAAGVQSIDVIWTALDDLEGLEAEAGQARRLGFTGKAAIHPDQLATINQAFSPTPDEVAYAVRVISAYEAGGRRRHGRDQLRGRIPGRADHRAGAADSRSGVGPRHAPDAVGASQSRAHCYDAHLPG